MPNFENVTEYATVEGGERKLIRRNDYMRLHYKETPRGAGEVVYLQHGRVVTENDTVVEDIPQWLRDLAPTLNPAALAAVGFTVDMLTGEPPRRGPGRQPKQQEPEDV